MATDVYKAQYVYKIYLCPSKKNKHTFSLMIVSLSLGTVMKCVGYWLTLPRDGNEMRRKLAHFPEGHHRTCTPSRGGMLDCYMRLTTLAL